MPSLISHPDCLPGVIVVVDATLVPTERGCRATFSAFGAVEHIVMPPVEADRGRFDDLWRTTCFEIFWQPEGGSYYREFNLSPSTRWACYDFDDFRAGMRNAPADVFIDVTTTFDTITLTADIVSDLPRPARVALNAIFEQDGINRYWALAFAPGAPEFHSPVCRVLSIPA